MARGLFKARVQQKVPKARCQWCDGSASGEEWGWRIIDGEGDYISDAFDSAVNAWRDAWFKMGGTR